MRTRKLYKDQNWILVNAGSEKEKALLAAGWADSPALASKSASAADPESAGKEQEPDCATAGGTNPEQAPEVESGAPESDKAEKAAKNGKPGKK